jgi:hypothetical protein
MMDLLLSGSPSLVAVVQPTDLRHCHDRPLFRRLNRSRLWCVLPQRKMGSRSMIQVDNQLPIVLNRESSFIRGIPGMGVFSGFMEPW